MKKIYSLMLAVAATAMVANAAAPVAKMQREFVAPQKLEVVKNDVQVAAKATAAKTSAKAIAKAGEYDEYLAIPEGEYFLVGTTMSGSMGLLDFNLAKGEAENTYTLKADMDGAVAVPATASIKTYETASGNVTLPVLSIKGQGQVPFIVDGDKTYSVWALGREDGTLYRYSNDIEFIISTTGELLPVYAIGLGWLNTEGRGNGFVEMEGIFLANANWTATITTDTSSEGNLPMHVAIDKNKVLLTGLFGYFDKEIELEYNIENAYVSGENVELTSFTGTDGNKHILNLVQSMNGQLYNAVVMNVEEENGKSYLVADGCDFYAYCLEDNETFGGWYSKFSDVEIELNFPLKDTVVAGVNDITVNTEVNENAPVEYFNLQGVRVAEPAAGLYIRRQGNDVKKVVIR